MAAGCSPALTCCCLLLLLLGACSSLMRIPLRLHAQRPAPSRRAAAYISRRSAMGVAAPLPRLRRRTAIVLSSAMASLYYGEVKFGTPPQTVRILFDTGSDDLWVLNTRYYLNYSSTFITTSDVVSIEYADSTNVAGNRSFDTLSLGNITLGNQTFILVTDLNYVHEYDYDGVMGMAPQPSSSDGLEPPLARLLRNGMLLSGVFSLYLTSNDTDDFAGELTLGGTNPDYYSGSFFYADVLKPCCWQIAVDGIAVGCKPAARVCAGGCQALVDSGTSFITGPSLEIRRLHELIGAQQRATGSLYEVNCSVVPSLPDVRLTIGGRSFVLTSDQYIERVGADSCTSVFGPLDAQKLWILGSAFMKLYYITFDLQHRRIGFAELKSPAKSNQPSSIVDCSTSTIATSSKLSGWSASTRLLVSTASAALLVLFIY